MFLPGDRVRYVRVDPYHVDGTLEIGKVYVVKHEDEGMVILQDDPNDPEGFDSFDYEASCFEQEDPTNSVPYCIKEIVKTAPKRKAKRCSKSAT